MSNEDLRILAIGGWGVALIFFGGFAGLGIVLNQSLKLAADILSDYSKLVHSLPAKLGATDDHQL